MIRLGSLALLLLCLPLWLLAGDVVKPETAAEGVEQTAQEPKAFMGVYPDGRAIDVVLAKHLSVDKGYILGSLLSGAPAACAGLQTHDIILSFDGVAVGNFQELAAAVLARSPGETVDVIYLHAGEKKSTSLTLISRPAIVPLRKDVGRLRIQLTVSREMAQEREMLGGEVMLKHLSHELGDDLGPIMKKLPSKMDLDLGKGTNRIGLRRLPGGLLLLRSSGKKCTYTAYDIKGKLLLREGDKEQLARLGESWSHLLDLPEK